MKIKDFIKEKKKIKTINEIRSLGYDDEQAKVLFDATKIYPRIIDFADPSYNVNQIEEVLTFFKHEDAFSIARFYSLEPSKRILMTEAYNKFSNLGPNLSIRTFRLVYDVACLYDETVLKMVIEKSITDKPDYDFLNTIRYAMDQDVSLYDLNYFSNLKKENKTK